MEQKTKSVDLLNQENSDELIADLMQQDNWDSLVPVQPDDIVETKQQPRIYCISDLHVEFYDSLAVFIEVLENIKLPNAEFLILAGDICDPLTRYSDYVDLLLYFKKKYANVILVAGNHEYYSCKYNRQSVVNAMKKIAEATNVVFLDREVAVINGVRFIGATLWSAIDKVAYDQMNDRQFVFENYIYYLDAFIEDFRFLKQELARSLDYDEPVVVVTHHLPSTRLVHSRFKGFTTNPGFSTNIVDLVNLHGVRYWFCGHTHEQQEVCIGGTIFSVNPMGYPWEEKERMTKTQTKVYNI